MMGLPFDGESILFVAIIKARHSSCASNVKGTCTAIWSPSKSALYALQTNGWSWIALPSTKTGSKAWIPNLCNVGARLSMTGCSLITSSKISQTSGSSLSTIRLASLIVLANSNCWSFPKTNGLKSSRAIFLGNPHWCNLRVGPTTITERPE